MQLMQLRPSHNLMPCSPEYVLMGLLPHRSVTALLTRKLILLSRPFSLSFTNGVLPAAITFTRASTGMYYDSGGVLQTAAINAPRFDSDPTTHAPKGLLIEPVATNICLSSSLFNVADWVPGNIVAAAPVVTANAVLGPNGLLEADQIDYPAVGAAQASNLTQQIAVTAAAYAFSPWLRGAVGGEAIYLVATPDGVTWISAGRLVLTTSWQRYLVTDTLSATGWYFNIGSDFRIPSWATTSAQTIYAWGADLKLGSVASSHVPTTTAAVTRSADVASFTVPNNVSRLLYTFDDDSTQSVAVSPGAYTIPTNLNRPWIKRIART